MSLFLVSGMDRKWKLRNNYALLILSYKDEKFKTHSFLPAAHIEYGNLAV
jgi:hypothetical protein